MTDNVHNKPDILEKYREAGRILKIVRAEAVDMVKVGNSLLEVAEYVEKRTIELGGRPAFPCNISRNEEAAHATPKAGDSDVFGKDMVKLDLGVHVDGYIADSAVTVNLSGGNSDILKAAEEALAAAIDLARPGITTGKLGAAIEQSIRSYGLNPITNLTGHGLSCYEAHDNPSVPNKHVEGGTVLKEGDVLAIEPFATNGAGIVHDGNWAEIYSIIRKKPVRLPQVRNVLKQAEEYKELPFAKRWLKADKLEFSLIQLEKAGILHAYPVLIESTGGLVAQAEHTIIITQDGCEVTTK